MSKYLTKYEFGADQNGVLEKRKLSNTRSKQQETIEGHLDGDTFESRATIDPIGFSTSKKSGCATVRNSIQTSKEFIKIPVVQTASRVARTGLDELGMKSLEN